VNLLKSRLANNQSGPQFLIDFGQIDPINQEGFCPIQNCIRSGLWVFCN
jgi:hypothetical protein